MERSPASLMSLYSRRAKFPTPEEELVLIESAQNGDHAAIQQLLRNQGPLMVRAAKQAHYDFEHQEDALTEIVMAVIHSIEKYDLTSGVRLSSYSKWWIRSVVGVYRRRCGLIRIPENSLTRIGNSSMRQLRNRLYSQMGTLDDRKVDLVLAERMGLSLETVSFQRMVRQGTIFKSLDTPLFEDGSMTGMDILPDDDELGGIEARYIHRDEVIKILDLASRVLDAREYRIIQMRFLDERSLRDIAIEMNLSWERIRQLEMRGMGKLRRAVSREMQMETADV